MTLRLSLHYSFILCSSGVHSSGEVWLLVAFAKVKNLCKLIHMLEEAVDSQWLLVAFAKVKNLCKLIHMLEQAVDSHAM